MQMHRNYHCISIKQIRRLENGRNILLHNKHGHALSLSLSLSLFPTLATSLPGMKYELVPHTLQSIIAETMPWKKLCNSLYETMNELAITYCL
jgi:hypothetical protein